MQRLTQVVGDRPVPGGLRSPQGGSCGRIGETVEPGELRQVESAPAHGRLDVFGMRVGHLSGASARSHTDRVLMGLGYHVRDEDRPDLWFETSRISVPSSIFRFVPSRNVFSVHFPVAMSNLERKNKPEMVVPSFRLEVGNRLREVEKRFANRAAAAQAAGVAKSTLQNWIEGKADPSFEGLTKLARAAGVSVEWLAGGESAQQDAMGGAVAANLGLGAVPVLGLAQCGLQGWYQEGQMAVRASRPGDLADPQAFAVIAVGESMRPAGISPGYLCFCSPAASVDASDIVFIERRDAGALTASIKRLRRIETGWLHLEGWLPPEDGTQAPYTEKVRRSQITRLAAVIYIKIKL